MKEFGAQETKHLQYMKKLYDKAKNAGENFTVSSDMQIPDKYKSPMHVMLSKHEYVKDGYGQKCICAHLPNLDNSMEWQRRIYIALAIIHDNMLPEAKRINNDILPSELAGHIWKLFSPYQVFDNDDRPWYGDKKPFLEVAMMSIQEEVAKQQTEGEQPTEAGQNAKTIVAIVVSFILSCIYLLSVWYEPFPILTWFKNHPNSYGLQSGIVCLITCMVVGFFKPQWRKWWWWTASLAFIVLILSLLGGKSR